MSELSEKASEGGRVAVGERASIPSSPKYDALRVETGDRSDGRIESSKGLL